MFTNSIIIPTYNHVALLKQCIESIKTTTDLKKTEVIVVANGCKDETEKYVLSLGEPFQLINSREPLGFTRAVNIGIMASSGKNIILLNDDAMILNWGNNDGWIKMLEAPFADPKMAATGASQDYWSKGNLFLIFFCVMIPKKLLLQFGLLDEVFNPGAGEDADFCIKVQQAGYKIRQVPREFNDWKTEFPIYHIGHVTCGGVVGWDAIGARNTAILETRYHRTEEDRKMQKEFSKGLQNFNQWAK